VSDAFLAAFDRLPLGAFTARYNGRIYHAVRRDFAGGRSQELVAHEAGGTDYISLNLYRLQSGARLKPCEMPEKKVVRFVIGLDLVEG
jgi:hypothetical protein